MAGHEGCFQMDARLTGHRLGDTQLSCVIGRFAHCQDLAALSHRNGLLLQLANDRVDHFISRAKKADAFFKIVTSCFSCAFSCSSCRILCCSAVSGLPMPGWPFCSAAYCVSQRRISVWPMLMVSLTFWTLWPFSLIMRTTSSFKLVSNTLRFLVVMFNSLQVVYFPPIEVSGQIRPLQHGVWEVHFIKSCLIHERYLIHQCQICGALLEWERGGLLHCRCGASLSSMQAVAVGPSRSDLDLLISESIFPTVEGLASLSQSKMLYLLPKSEPSRFAEFA